MAGEPRIVMAELVVDPSGAIAGNEAAEASAVSLGVSGAAGVQRFERESKTAFEKIGLSNERLLHGFIRTRQLVHGLFLGFSVGGIVLGLAELIKHTVETSSAFQTAKEAVVDWTHAIFMGETEVEKLERHAANLSEKTKVDLVGSIRESITAIKEQTDLLEKARNIAAQPTPVRVPLPGIGLGGMFGMAGGGFQPIVPPSQPLVKVDTRAMLEAQVNIQRTEEALFKLFQQTNLTREEFKLLFGTLSEFDPKVLFPEDLNLRADRLKMTEELAREQVKRLNEEFKQSPGNIKLYRAALDEVREALKKVGASSQQVRAIAPLSPAEFFGATDLPKVQDLKKAEEDALALFKDMKAQFDAGTLSGSVFAATMAAMDTKLKSLGGSLEEALHGLKAFGDEFKSLVLAPGSEKDPFQKIEEANIDILPTVDTMLLLTEALRKQGDVLEILIQKYGSFRLALRNATVEELKILKTAALHDMMQKALLATIQATAAAYVEMLATGRGAWKELAANALKAVATEAVAQGTLYVLEGLAMALLGYPNGGAVAAIGGELIAFGTALGLASRALGGGKAAPAGGSRVGQQPGGPFDSNNPPRGQREQTINLFITGNGVIFSTREDFMRTISDGLRFVERDNG